MNPALEDLSTSKTDNNVELLRFLLRSDRRLTVRMVASELNFNHTTVHPILTQELATRKVCVKIVSFFDEKVIYLMGQPCQCFTLKVQDNTPVFFR